MSSRDGDLAHVEDEVKKRVEERKRVSDEFEIFAKTTQDSVNEILKKAGVYEAVNALGKSTMSAQERAQARINQLSAEIERFSSIRAYLTDRNVEEAKKAKS
jgi:hypothetical protein